MEARHWQLIKELVTLCLELSADERVKLLDSKKLDSEIRKHVESLLDVPSSELSFLEFPLIDLKTNKISYSVPSNVGPYRIIRLLGCGGMGEVYEAKRIDGIHNRTSALKLLSPALGQGGIFVERFEEERRILASLEHPHIARLYEGGTTEDGRPYLVMELVEGEPINKYCDNNNLALSSRIKLFIKVCEAVEFAHRRLVLHRDLKSAHVIVSNGEPKLLDFGIAKVLSSVDQKAIRTTPGQLPVTLPYASPEVLMGSTATMASDVYSLGVVLFEMLVGVRPFEFYGTDRFEAAAIIDEQQPPLPSLKAKEQSRVFWRALVGDLDNILLHALSSSPETRYGSVERLIADLWCYLEGRPVSARPPNWFDYTTKFIYRHRTLVSIVSLIFVILVSFVALLLEQQQRVVKERNRAEAAVESLIGVLGSMDAEESLGADISAEELLDRGTVIIKQDLAKQPALQAQLRLVVGRLYAGLGIVKKAQKLLEASLRQHENLFGDKDVASIEAAIRLAEIETVQGSYLAAERRLLKALNYLPARHPLRPVAIRELATIARDLAKYKISDNLYLHALQLQQRYLEPVDKEIIKTLSGRAWLLYKSSRLEEAEFLYTDILSRLKIVDGHKSSRIALVQSELAGVYRDQGRLKEAEALLLDSIDMAKITLGIRHPDLTTNMVHDLALTYNNEGRWSQAESLYREAISSTVEKYGKNHYYLAEHLSALGSLYLRTGRLVEAERELRLAVEMLSNSLGAEHPTVVTAYSNLGNVLVELSRFDEASIVYKQCLEMRQKLFGFLHPFTATSLTNLGSLQFRRGEIDEAVDLLEKALKIYEETMGHDHLNISHIAANLGAAYGKKGDFRQSELLLQRSLQIREKWLGRDHPDVANSLNALGQLLNIQERPAEAKLLLERSLKICERSFGENHPAVAVVLINLADVSSDLGDFVAAGKYFEKALKIRIEIFGNEHPIVHRTRERYANFKEKYLYVSRSNIR